MTSTKMGRGTNTEVLCRQHLLQYPKDAGALNQLALLCSEQGRSEEAIGLLTEAVRIEPKVGQFRINLAAVLGKAGLHSKAVSELLVALRLRTNLAEVHNNLGAALEHLGRLNEAVASFRNAISQKLDYYEAHCNLGGAFRKLGKLDEANSAFEQAISVDPARSNAYEGASAISADRGETEKAVDQLRKAVELNPTSNRMHSALLYTLHYDPNLDRKKLLDEHKNWASRHTAGVGERSRIHSNTRTLNRRLRIGYVSPDFRDHTVPRFIGGAFANHDKSRFEIFCYSDVRNGDKVTEKLKSQADHWREIAGWPDERVEQVIRQDAIDILIDLRGHAAGNRLLLFARKPAPVQANMVGYFDTTGIDAIDYRITDEHQDPPGEADELHVEKLMRLKPGCWCYVPDTDAPDVTPPPALRNGYVTFGSLNKVVKISEPCGRLWAVVLNAVPRSRMLLSVSSPDCENPLRRRLEEFGIPIDRVDIQTKTKNRADYLARFGQIDIALDTYPFNGITTTCDGLWMGVPTVSLAGSTTVSRAGRSILFATNLEKLSALDEQKFVSVASSLADDLKQLAELRAGMRQRIRSSGIGDHRSFTLELENAFAKMWRTWCEQSDRCGA